MPRLISLLCLLLPLSAAATDRLAAPHPQAPPAMSQFQFLVGEFAATIRSLDGDGNYVESQGRWVGYYTLDGYAFQDDFYGDGWRGTTWRTYDPQQQRWVNRWLMANVETAPGFTSNAFFGRAVDGQIHIEARGKDPRGDYVDRIRFEDISADGFTWRMSRSYDDGATWIEDLAVTDAKRLN